LFSVFGAICIPAHERTLQLRVRHASSPRVCLGRHTRENAGKLNISVRVNHINRTLCARMHAHPLTVRAVASNDFPRQFASVWNFTPHKREQISLEKRK